jgi:hypothetical protein
MALLGITPLVSCALKHPNSLERQVPQMPHMLIVVGCVRSNIRCCCHDRNFLGLGQQIRFVNVCFQISGDIVHIGPGLDV